MTGCAIDGAAPFKALLTHGFVVDGDGRKMSKSLGIVIAPQDIANTLGAQIIRLWTASTDYAGEMSISKTILDRVVEAYRRIRNTLRFIFANTSDLDLQLDLLPAADLFEIDRFALAECHEFVAYCTEAYTRYDFVAVIQRLQTYCSEDLGGFYFDVLKDRLYTAQRTSWARKGHEHSASFTRRLRRPLFSTLVIRIGTDWAVLVRCVPPQACRSTPTISMILIRPSGVGGGATDRLRISPGVASASECDT
jgi:isoleucyl-tRNA synthetase